MAPRTEGSIQQLGGDAQPDKNAIKLTQQDVGLLRMLKIANWEFKDEM
jgi:hypothetical protein